MNRTLTAILVLSALAFVPACGGNTPSNNISVINANAPKVNKPSEVAVSTPAPATMTNNAPTLSAVFKSYCDAFRKKDEAGVRKVYAAETLKRFEADMRADKVTSLLTYLEDDAPSGECTVRNEVILGDKATADLVSGTYPEGIGIIFVKENGEWKMTNQSPAINAVKDSKSDAKTAK